ncbi:erythromycin esterase family protein [Bordetella genomosp. 13]|nr:erythromycin esterase family protein [Bordetella genomosp. 13]
MGNDRDDDELAVRVGKAALPWTDADGPAFARLFDRYADRRVVLLGEASHGTSDFYRARAAATRRLIEHHGCTIVALEADWPDAALLDRQARGRGGAADDDPAAFGRFPTWMWRNTDFAAFAAWLRDHNANVPAERQVRIYGLDMYSLGQSMAAVLAYLDKVDPTAGRIARQRYGCLAPWRKDPAAYGHAALTSRHAECEQAVLAQLRDLLERRLEYAGQDGDDFFDAAQNARLVAAAERYYRAMYLGSAQSWNLRDTHMFETLEHVLRAHGEGANAVVWAHNSHIGDAAATEMGSVRDEINIGQLCRERYGRAAALIGFGTHTGTVAAAGQWEGPMEVMAVRPALAESYECLMHRTDIPRFMLDMDGLDDGLRENLARQRLERFIGVIYRPETERYSHYVRASLTRQFDAYVWMDRTSAVTPLPTARREGLPDTWPFGL